MRAMLTLALLCSLASIVSAIDPKKVEGCLDGSTYKCFVPDKCTDPDHTPTIEGGDLTELKKNIQIVGLAENCGVIVKFHQYQDHWAFVSMESFEPGIRKIELEQRDSSDKIVKSLFSCEKTPTEVMGKYSYKGDRPRDITFPQENLPASTNLICNFDVKLNTNEKIFGKAGETGNVRMIVDSKESKPTSITLAFRRCDPMDFLFEHETKPEKVYDKVILHGPGDYRCKEPIYKMEYKNNGKYEDVTDIRCSVQHFEITTTKSGLIPHPQDTWVYVRCVADAQYFCEEAVKNAHSGETKGLDQVLPDRTTNRKGSLKCPHGYPHLFIDKQLPITNPTFECRNFGGKSLWTVNNIYLASEGPAVYCSATIPCQIRNRISSNAVKGGFLDDEYLPRCHLDGELKVDGSKVTNRRCDGKTGQFKYTTSGKEKDVTKETKFECEYPPANEEVAQKNAENRKLINYGLIIIAPSVLGLFAVIALAAFFIMKCRMARATKKLEAEIDAGFIYYSMTPEEKKAAREKNLIPPDSELKKALEPIHWGKFMMSLQYAGMKLLNLTGKETKEPVTQLPPLKENVARFAMINKWQGPKPILSRSTTAFIDLQKMYKEMRQIAQEEFRNEQNEEKSKEDKKKQ